MSDHPLSALNVTVRIPPSTILDAVSCDLHDARVTGFLGPNGAGKTTLLRALAGTLTPTDGQVRLDGSGIGTYSRRAVARRLGVVPQHPNTALELPVREIVAMGRFCHRPIYASLAGDDEEAIDAAMSDMALDGVAERAAHTLSGGERQRMYLAQLLAQDASVVLLDEPTSHLDIQYQGEILTALRSLVSERGWTVGVVLHDLNLAFHFCDRLVFLKAGKVAAAGEVADVATAGVVQETYGVAVELSENGGRPHVRVVY
ncbi:ABC transporter ATP-binding protein [Candidatus Poribacteria bacterium]|jgi:iron complex transport system ATP-binding protein|nr:ABC transporter ATP-binding protein [Candidatus Poribacteria bacterium]MBT5532912.1 ABC transporter ATP-binding protein [Candidatus Poribacteria bacterium]MBT5710420.1 ABC transporter ATP-binding protein [Candidatus Poribacteria bacterium]MBT7804681.1 ABC transporter ATP-binding protein [Candidatus Poribacteria bacterium]